MSNFAKWLFADKANDKDAGGCYVPATVTGAAVATFANALASYCDVAVAKTEVHTITINSYTPPASGTSIERTGLITIQEIASPETKYNIALPAISEDSIDPNGDATHKVLASVCAAVLSAWATMTGLTATDYQVSSSKVYYRK